jgi:hypothetical protein
MPKRWIWFSLVLLLTLSACAQLGVASALETETPEPTETEPASTPRPSPSDAPEATAPSAEPGPTATAGSDAALAVDEPPPSGAEAQFSTDFSKHSVPYSEILSGGPPKDGIPAIDRPQFVAVTEADEWLEDLEPVVLFQARGEARAYPLQILTWHEIVNDEVGGTPVVITFCPLCNTAIAFERTFDGQVLDFGTTGRLRFSNLIMYDRQTETWWQQATGDAIAGEYTGSQLTFLPASIISWSDFQSTYPDSLVLSRNTGFGRDYGRNPYAGYDNIRNSPFLYRGPDNSGRLPPMARVLTVELEADTVAYPYELLEAAHVVNDEVGGQQVAIFWEPGTASALDAGALASGRDVGSASAYSRLLDGETLDFTFDGGNIVDKNTGSAWNVLGQAVSGPLAGAQLEPVVSVNHFWFSWAAFKPETRIYQAG